MVVDAGSSTAASLRQLAEKYGMDVERLEELVRSVNVPSVREPLSSAGVSYVRDAESGEDIAVKEVSFFFGREGVCACIAAMLIWIFFTGGVEGANA